MNTISADKLHQNQKVVQPKPISKIVQLSANFMNLNNGVRTSHGRVPKLNLKVKPSARNAPRIYDPKQFSTIQATGPSSVRYRGSTGFGFRDGGNCTTKSARSKTGLSSSKAVSQSHTGQSSVMKPASSSRTLVKSNLAKTSRHLAASRPENLIQSELAIFESF